MKTVKREKEDKLKLSVRPLFDFVIRVTAPAREGLGGRKEGAKQAHKNITACKTMHSAVSCDTPSQDYATTHIHDTPSDINANRPPRPSADASTGADVSSHTYKRRHL